MEDHAMSFDWILYAILFPPVLLAIFELIRTWRPSPQAMRQGEVRGQGRQNRP